MAPPSLRFTALFAALLLFACANWRSDSSSVDVTSTRLLPAGPVVGVTGQYGSHVWRGLPYAQPPVADLRWRAPQKPEPFTQLRQALETGEACVQYASIFAGEEPGNKGLMGDEDCLYLDVYAPRFAEDAVPAGDARLPVMLWIHGGGNTIGRGGFYDGGKLAATQDVIVVSINYRLGPFGWFRHQSLRDQDGNPLDDSGNFGTLDMIRALEWVQENASAFGGDPNRVTLFGESAGGTDVLSLLLSPLAKGLYHGAIIQSGGMGIMEPSRAEDLQSANPDAHGRSSNEVLLQLLAGDTVGRAAAKERLAAMSSAEVANYLRSRPAGDLLAAYGSDEVEGITDVPAVFRDGHVLPAEAPIELLRRGEYNQVPVILGSNRDENKLFMVYDPEFVSWWLGAIPRARNMDVYQGTAAHLANAWKARAVDVPARLMNAVQGDSVYAYRWDWDEEPGVWGLYDGGEMVGAGHGLEIAFVFGHFDLGPESGRLFSRGNREARELLSGQMMNYWAEFAHTGSPGQGRVGNLQPWKPWDETDKRAPKYLVLDTASSGGLRMDTRVYDIPSVVKEIAGDDRLPESRQKCSVLRDLTNQEDLTRSEYESAAAGLCSGYALDAHPWVDVATEP